MKRVIVCTILCMLLLCGCRNEVERKIIDSRYTPSYQGIETTYEHKYSFEGEGDWKLMPNTHTVMYPEKYELQYRIYYDDGTTETEWVQVAKDEYEAYKE